MSTLPSVKDLEYLIMTTIKSNKIISNDTTLSKSTKRIKNSIGMIRLDEPFEPNINYLKKLWVST